MLYKELLVGLSLPFFALAFATRTFDYNVLLFNSLHHFRDDSDSEYQNVVFLTT